MALPRPVVLVYQEYATLSTVPATPELNVLIAGPAYHVQDFLEDKGNILTSVLYGVRDLAATGTSVAPSAALVIAEPPNNITGAQLDASSVKVHFGNASVEIAHASDITTAENSADVTSVGTDFAAAGVKAQDKLVLTRPAQEAVAGQAATLTVNGVTYTAMNEGVTGNLITVTLSQGTIEQSLETTVTDRVAEGKTYHDILITFPEGMSQFDFSEAFSPADADNLIYVIVTTGNMLASVLTALAEGVDAVAASAESTITRTIRSVATKILVCTSELPSAGYDKVRVERTVTEGAISDSFVSVAGNEITIASGVTLDSKPVTAAEVSIAYRALRTDLQEVTYVNDFNALKALFGRTLSASATDTRVHSGVDARNPLAVGAAIALLNTNTSVQIFGIGEDSAAGYSSMLSAISNRKDVYAVVPLTSELSVVAELKTEFDNLASTEYALTNGVPQKFRVVLGSVGALPSFGIVADKSSTGQIVAPTGPALITVHTLKVTLPTPALSFVDLGILPGFTIDLDTGPALVTLTVAHVNAADELEVVDGNLTAGSSIGSVVIHDADGAVKYTGTATVEKAVDAALHLELYDANASFLDGASAVTAGHYLELPLNPSLTTFGATVKFEIAAVLSNQRLRIKANGRDTALVANELPHGYSRIVNTDGELIAVPTTATLTYRVVKSLDRDGQVSELIAVAQSIKSRRAVLCWPDKVDVASLTDGSLPRSSATPNIPAAAGSQPGYYLACAVGGMTAGLPSHQGFTNLGIAGISKIYNANTYFTDRQITQISNNGWFVFQQDTPNALPYVVHQLTTDPSTLQFGEFSLVKNFDFVSMFFSDILDDYLGIWNMNKDTFGYIETALSAGIDNLKLRRRVRIGAPIIDARITKLGESELSEDRLEVFIEADFPKPLNTVGLHIVSA